MRLAHHFPGLQLSVKDVGEMTPEETRALLKAGDKVLREVELLKLEHTKMIAKVAGMRVR